MNPDLGPAFLRAQMVVNGLVAAMPSVVVALVVFGVFLALAAIVKGVVARLTLARLHAHRNAGMAVGRLAQGLVTFLGLLVALSVALPTFRPGDVVQVLGISKTRACAVSSRGPAGKADVPASWKVADAIAQISRSKPRTVNGQ